MISLIALAMLMVYGIMEFVRSRMLVRAGLQFDDVLTNTIFPRVVKARLANPNGGAEYILSDIDKVREFLTGQGILTFFDALWVPLFLVICYLFHPWLGAIAAGGAIVIFVLAFLNDFTTKKQLQEANNAVQSANQFAGAVLQNAEVIKSMGMEKPLGERWQDRHATMLTAQAGASDKAGAVMAFSKFIRMALQSAILGMGAYLALQQQVSPGVMIAASIMMGRALSPVEQSVAQWKQFVAARQASQRMKRLFDSVPADLERTELPKPVGEISVEQFTTLVPGTRTPLLKGINFQVPAGQTLAVVGPSGSGKSTLLRSLVGVQPAANGTIRIDGAELSQWNAEQLGQHLGYLPQDVKLFAGTIAENISRFRDADSDDVVRAAKMAGVHEMILHLKDGYETQIGDNGHQLSGGQRQRVGLARALFGLPQIVILDEPNSNLDNDGEAALTDAIRSLKEIGITVIVATHKTNLLAVCDKVLVMQDGAVRALTTPRELLKPAESVAPKNPAKAAAAPVVNNVVNVQ
ncbi:peptidase [Maritalea porphyrae]|uniref:Peptidase n=2 Tax=Maritalea porphyrae TaxID=880732 RepID=A0ABQ5UR13_9HYPH|nr:peptidase [Maritalea porphyrae]